MKKNKKNFFKIREDSEGNVYEIGGITSWYKHIIMNTLYSDFENPDKMYYLIHEIFHTFGFEDATKTGRKNGIMNYPPEKPNKEDSQEIADSVF